MALFLCTGCKNHENTKAEDTPADKEILHPVQEKTEAEEKEEALASLAIANPYLVLVNKEHPIEDRFNPACSNSFFSLTQISKVCSSSGISLEEQTAKALESMMLAMKAEGIKNVFITSGWRSEEKQQALFSKYEQREASGISQRAKEFFGKEYLQTFYFSSGVSHLSESDAVLVANYYSAFPGQSEHHTGLCVDFFANGLKNQSDFANTSAFHWLSLHANEYGFILRYPKGKESITGYCYEPWHFRYVGIPSAQNISSSGKCLEEWLGEQGRG